MNVDEMLQGAQNAIAVSRVYGEPIQQNGVTLIPTAEVMGGGGGGSDQANNGGGGFGVSARPVGMWVIRGEPIQQNGVTLIPTAEVMGGGGGGSDQASNGGGGFGVSARPVGMWVIRGEQVAWEPAIDATKMGLRGMLVAIVFLLVIRSVVKTLAGR